MLVTAVYSTSLTHKVPATSTNTFVYSNRYRPNHTVQQLSFGPEQVNNQYWVVESLSWVCTRKISKCIAAAGYHFVCNE